MSIISWLENAASSVGAFVKKEISAIGGDATVVVASVENSTTIANNVVNALKDFVNSPMDKTIDGVIEAVPGIGPYFTAVLNFLPTLVTDLGWAKAEFTKSPAQILHDGITAAVNAPTSNIKATNLITLQAHINNQISALAQAPISIQAATALAPAVYDGIEPSSVLDATQGATL